MPANRGVLRSTWSARERRVMDEVLENTPNRGRRSRAGIEHLLDRRRVVALRAASKR